MEEKITKRKITSIEINYSTKRELKELSNKIAFRGIIMRDSFKAIKDAIKNNDTTVELFNIVNLSLIVEVKRSQFSTIIQRLIDIYVEEEDYDKCAELQTLIEGL